MKIRPIIPPRRADSQVDEAFRNAPNNKSSFVRVYSDPSSSAGL